MSVTYDIACHDCGEVLSARYNFKSLNDLDSDEEECRGLIYQMRAYVAEVMLNLALTIAPAGICKLNVAKALLDYARAAKEEIEHGI